LAEGCCSGKQEIKLKIGVPEAEQPEHKLFGNVVARCIVESGPKCIERLHDHVTEGLPEFVLMKFSAPEIERKPEIS